MAKTFFIPGISDEKQEAEYARFTKRCKCPVPASDARIYSIEFTRADVRWRATVGEKLAIVAPFAESADDEPQVKAIFACENLPCKVVTDRSNTKWSDPFLAKPHPNSIVYFTSGSPL